MSSRKNPKMTANERREDVLRPSPWLGYDRDKMAVFLLSKGAYPISEAEFRRAIWLNPYEPVFKIHLAMCLCRQKRFEEARDCLDECEQSDRTDYISVREAIVHGLTLDNTSDDTLHTADES